MIIENSKETKQRPFLRAVYELRGIFGSSHLTPLEKLYKLQTLDVMAHFEQNKEAFDFKQNGK